MAITVPQLLRSMAAYIATVPGVKSAHYPAPNQLQPSQFPAVVLFWGRDGVTTRITADEMWSPAVTGQLLFPRNGDTPFEFSKVDELVTPIHDAFGVDADGNMVALDRLVGLGGHLDRCLLSEVETSLEIPYAGHQYYGARLYFDIKMFRTPGGLA